MKKKTDLFGFFDKMNSGDYSYVDGLSDDDVKGLSPYVLLMWCNGATTNRQEHVMLTNEYCNQYVFSLAKHPRLLLKLFIAANSEMGNTRYQFTTAVSAGSAALEKTICEVMGVSLHEAKDFIRMRGEEIKEYIEENYGSIE